jgi:hypothetical protein
MMVVDGWVNPEIQSQYYAGYLRSWGLTAGSTVNDMLKKQANVVVDLKNGDLGKAETGFDDLTGDGVTVPAGNFSVYDIFEYPEGGRDPYSIWLNANKHLLGVPDSANFSSGNENIYNAFKEDMPKSYMNYLVDVSSKMPVIVINGQLDYIVNTEGVINALDQAGLIQGQGLPWKVNKKVAGRVYQGRVTLVVVNLAGHTVPEYQPENSLDAIQHLLTNNRNWDN